VAYDAGPVMKAMQAEGLPGVFTETLATGWWTSCLEVLPARERSKGRW
jgi:hypothetical protein